MKIGILTVSDRASRGEYEDKGGPAIKAYLDAALATPWTPLARVVPDGADPVASALVSLCEEGAGMILATGGTGPSPRDETPEAVARVIDKELPGFGELMRRISLETVPTAILSRQGAGIRGRTLIVTLPGRPAAIKVCLDAVFPAIPYCLELIGAGRIETHPGVVAAFRPGG
jgi:molybdopterin adenylyltransferase